MAALDVQDGGLVVRFDGSESRWVRRELFAVPLTSIDRIQVLPGWTSEPMGMHSGLVVSGFRKVGMWTSLSGVRRLLCMKRGLPILRIGLRPGSSEFAEVLVSSADAPQVASRLTGAAA